VTVYPLQANMTRGEATPLVHARADTEHYAACLQLARNVVVMRYGGVTRAPGSLYLGDAKNANKTARFIRFEFNRDQVYAIEAGDLYFRFWTADGRIESPPGTPIEVVTPYVEADLKYLRVRQLGDVIYIWCRKTDGSRYQPRTLTRTSETVWTLAVHSTEGGPYMREETNGATMTPASYGSITPLMTSDTTPSGTVSRNASGSASAPFYAFDKNVGTSAVPWETFGYIQYRQAGGLQVVADAYYLVSPYNQLTNEDMPTEFFLQGSNDGVTFITLDYRKGETGWTNSETRFYDFPNSTAYEYYRLSYRGGGGAVNAGSAFGEIGIHQKASDQTPFNLTLSSAAAINGGAGFLASDVGRTIRLLPSDGRWRDATIAARTSSTVVTIRLGGHALPDLNPISRWQLGAFSDESGWPASGAVYEDRLFHASTEGDPLGLWGSVNADYDNHEVSSPLVADDGVSVRLTGGKLDDISWLTEMRDSLVVGTAGALRAVGRNNDNEALGPANFRQRNQTLAPASIAEPVVIENALLFLDLFEQKLYEAMYTYEVDGFVAREASALNEHLFAAGVVEIIYLQHPHSIIVGRRYDGKLIFFTYDRANKVAGGTLVDYEGEVESVLDLPGETGTDLWMVVKRTIDGAAVRHIERMAEFWRSEYTVQDVPVYAAAAAIYDGVPITSITTADHLEGETVGVWADGRDIGDAEVSGGIFTLPGGVSASQVVYGLRMPWQVRTMRLSQIGNRDGSGLGRSVSIVSGMIDLYESAGIFFGAPGVSDQLRFEDEAEENPGDPVTLRTGMFAGPVDDNWRNDGVLDIQGDKLYPATIRAIQLNIDGEP
jgi:hypothetical protein